MNAPRVLVTGSRDWTDELTISTALYNAWADLGHNKDAVLVQGDCHLGGADIIAKRIWQEHSLPVESHPAEMGPDGHVLGPKRNANMVRLGADLCLAFPLPSSRGTRNCMRLAREAGIPVRVYEPALAESWLRPEPRVLEGDWETVRDALDALPLGTVIKWSDDLGYSAAIKCPNVMGDARWFEAGVRNPRSSESIARDETPIEVIA